MGDPRAASPPLRPPLHGALGQATNGSPSWMLHHEWAGLAFGVDGEMRGGMLEGCYEGGTLLISGFRLRINGEKPTWCLSSQVSAFAWSAVGLVPGAYEEG